MSPLPRPSNARPPERPLPAPSQGANETHPPARSEANGHGRNPNPSPLKPVPEGAEPAPGPEPSLEIPARRRRGCDSRQSHRPLEMSRPNARPLERKRGQCRTGRSPPLLRPALDSQAQRRLLCNDPSGCDYPQTRSFHHHAEPDSRQVKPQSAGKRRPDLHNIIRRQSPPHRFTPHESIFALTQPQPTHGLLGGSRDERVENHSKKADSLSQIPERPIQGHVISGLGHLPWSLFFHITIETSHQVPNRIQSTAQIHLIHPLANLFH